MPWYSRSPTRVYRRSAWETDHVGFQTPLTVSSVVRDIQRRRYVLPAIQREFVWSADKICTLFDSLMRGYPIGSFLFWKLGDDAQKAHQVYGFIQHWHEKTSRHCPELTDLLASDDRLAILDGQQRLTSLYIGLLGSHAERLPRAWWNNPNAFPIRHLYLNLAGTSATTDEAGAEGEAGDVEEFIFRFRTEEQAEQENVDGSAFWFRVADILPMGEAFDVVKWLQERERGNDVAASRLLHRLFKVVHEEGVINYFLEEAQSIDKVLNIFIRVNHQGVPLAFSDLLLSFATAKWTKRDARKEIYELVDRLNIIGHGFTFSKDLVMKSSLVLTDAPSIRFQVSSFDQKHMSKIEDEWPSIVQSLELGTGLLSDFGLSAASLTANSVLIPIAYYAKARGLTQAYRTNKSDNADRLAIRDWTFRALVKQGVWGSGLDTLLTNLRTALREHGATSFPNAEIRAAMARSGGKTLEFTPADIENFADLEYGDKRTFSVLTLLYPFVDTRNQFHVDHVFPRALLSAKALKLAGVDPADHAAISQSLNRLGNLQLLEGPHNLQKSDSPPKTWLAEKFPDEAQRAAWAATYDLDQFTDDPCDFLEFYEGRRSSLITKLVLILGVASTPPETESPDSTG